jgi:hypothetical protein
MHGMCVYHGTLISTKINKVVPFTATHDWKALSTSDFNSFSKNDVLQPPPLPPAYSQKVILSL